MTSSIYQDIWDADQDTHGVPALRPGEARDEQRGFVVVDETAGADSDHRVLAEVAIPEHKRHTYRLCERLFNNYQLDPALREIVSPGELREEQDFVGAVIELPPLRIAREFIVRDRGEPLSDHAFAAMIKESWFFQGMAGSKHASGFEHVFVGEQHPKGQPRGGTVRLGGYHFWYKYHLDDSAGRTGGDDIRYHSTVYPGAGNPAHGLLVPEVVTLSFSWSAFDFTTGRVRNLRKPIGGFWVGCSPEGLIALGLVRARTQAPKTAEINGARYGLDLHRLSDNRNAIRTFFPRFKSCSVCNVHEDPAEPPPSAGEPGRVRMLAALINPAGHDPGRETVTLVNVTPEAIPIRGWAIRAPNGTEFVFGDEILAGGEVRTFRLPSNSAQLRNRAGRIVLRDAAGNPQHEVTYSDEQARRQGFTSVF